MENNWVYIDEVIKLLTLNGVKELHVDTRSFSCLLLDKIVMRMKIVQL